jgi:hypothetical protein
MAVRVAGFLWCSSVKIFIFALSRTNIATSNTSPLYLTYTHWAACCIKSDAFVTRCYTPYRPTSRRPMCGYFNGSWWNLRDSCDVLQWKFSFLLCPEQILQHQTPALSYPIPTKNTHIKWFVDTITNYYNISNNISVHEDLTIFCVTQTSLTHSPGPITTDKFTMQCSFIDIFNIHTLGSVLHQIWCLCYTVLHTVQAHKSQHQTPALSYPIPTKNTHIKWFVDTITNYYNISNNISVHEDLTIFLRFQPCRRPQFHQLPLK